jgi:hypothetical protein
VQGKILQAQRKDWKRKGKTMSARERLGVQGKDYECEGKTGSPRERL